MTNRFKLTGLAFAAAALLLSCQKPPDAVKPPAQVVADNINESPPVIAGDTGEVHKDPSETPALRPFDGITVLLGDATVELDAWTCLEAGWLEQIACAPNSREHESLVVVKAKPSEIHAALLLAGFEPGSPGAWSYENDTVHFTQPTGERLDVFVRYRNSAGDTVQTPISQWIQDHQGRHEFPNEPWVFGGSAFKPNPQWMGPGEHYVADMTGSIIGLVTFGDEVIGFSRVIADQDAVQPPSWEVRADRIPPRGTEVTLILRRAGRAD